MDAKKTQTYISTVKVPIDPKCIEAWKNFRRHGDLRILSDLVYGTPLKNNKIFYAMLTGRAEPRLAQAIEHFYTTRLEEVEQYFEK